MKQIDYKTAEKIATSSHKELDFEIQCCQAEWIAKNAREIADIETKRRDKTNWGDWPDGWKREMIKTATKQAKSDLTQRFIDRKCREIDGVLWLNDWQEINALEKVH